MGFLCTRARYLVLMLIAGIPRKLRRRKVLRARARGRAAV